MATIISNNRMDDAIDEVNIKAINNDVSSEPPCLPARDEVGGAQAQTQAKTEDSSSLFGRFSESSGVDVFVGDLPKDLNEKDLHRVFGAFGTVSELLLKRAKCTKISLGYAFVKFSSHNEAKKALVELSKPGAVLGRDVRVGWAQRNCKIHVGNLESGVTAAELNAKFQSCCEQLLESETIVHAIGKLYVIRHS